MRESILEKDTLSFQLGHRPGVLRADRSEVMVGSVVDQLNEYMSKEDSIVTVGAIQEPTCINPELDAVMFYFMNHVVSLLRRKHHPLERLGGSYGCMNMYHDMLAIKSTRMFYYLLLICTRESRHVKDKNTSPLFKELAGSYGNACVKFHDTIRGTGSTTAQNSLRVKPPNTSLGNYTRFLSTMFREGSFQSSYGGLAWAAVADVLRDYVTGVISAEIMLDTAFTLAHNNGPIFNKGMLFEGYTKHIYEILDVQRSGQIPRMIANGETPWASVGSVKGCFAMCSDVLGDALLGGLPYVDWFLVQELGALHGCTEKQKVQVKKYGLPAKQAGKAVEDAKKIVEKNKAMELQGIANAQKALTEAGKWVQILPSLSVKKITKERVE